jgi:predicted nucleic acid-binding protein
LKRLWVDANVLLRFLTGEPADLAERAARLLAEVEEGKTLLVLPPLVLAEVVWVLKSFYRHPMTDIVKVLVPLLSTDGIEVEDRDLMIHALELARDKNVDFADAVLALQAVRQGESVCSFDQDFKRLPAAWIAPS